VSGTSLALAFLSSVASLIAADDGWDRTYGKACWPANSTFTDPACRCRDRDSPPHSKFATRPTIKVAIGSWLGAATNAFLLKFAIEQELGYPTELVTDKLGSSSSGDLTAQERMFGEMAVGEVHIYPEVNWTPRVLCCL
jgi:hypothetical protein